MKPSDSKRPIKVCFVSPKAYPLFDPDTEGTIGGAEVDLYMLSTELAKDDSFEISCITADYGQPTEQLIENVRVIKSLDFKQNSLTGAIKIWKALKKADANIYMLKTPSPGVPLTALFCSFHKRAFVYRLASSREFDGTYSAEHPIMSSLFKWSLSSAKLIFSQNDTDAQNVKKVTGRDAIVIPNGHRTVNTSVDQKDTILWVGRSAKVKGPYRFLELAESFPDLKFTMICQPATGDDEYDSLVEKAKAITNLDFHQSVPFAQIESYFAKAKVFVNTSDSEGFPNTFIQAAKCETAILSYNVNPDGFLDEQKCGICCSGSSKMMLERLRYLLDNETSRQFGVNGRKYVQNRHDIVKVGEMYKKILRDIAD